MKNEKFPDKYLSALINEFQKKSNEEIAKGQKKYMRNKFEFLGIKTPLKNEILKAHYKKFGYPEKSKMNNYVKFLWKQKEREFQYVAINFCEKLTKKFVPEDIEIIEFMIENKSWWDTVDGIIKLNKAYFQKFPELVNKHTEKWINSENFWFNRSALLFQLNYRDKMDKDLIFKYIQKVVDSKEFFVQKAIGWILRQYSKFNPDAIIEFVNNNKLAPLSKREALKVINKK